jgi:hypothetical protein
MKRLAAVALAAASLSACAEQSDAPLTAERESVVTARAVVQSVDQESRQVLLEGENGRMLSLTAGPGSGTWPSSNPATWCGSTITRRSR